MDDLLKLTQNLAAEHLGFAAGQLFRSRDLCKQPTDPWSWVEARRYALSSVLHAYCGLEAAVNLIAHKLFFDPQSDTYLPEHRRDLPLRRMVQAWSTGIQLTDKLSYILALTGNDLPPRLANELRELNNFRNWIAHGFTYNSTVLLAKQDGGIFIQVDREDSVDWQAKFPNTKFNPIDSIDHHDATLSLRIVLECVKCLSSSYNAPLAFWFNSLRNGPDFHSINARFDVDAYLAES